MPGSDREEAAGERARPKSRDTLPLRIASAAILAPATIGATWIGGPLFAGLVAFLCVLMAFEWARMIERVDISPVTISLSASGALAIALAAAGLFSAAYLVCAAGGLAAALTARRSRLWAAFGAAYFLAPATALVWLRDEVENGRGLALLLFAIVWSADTGGYIGGRLVGGPRLSPALSPAKTWAGAVGGVIAGALAAAAAAPLMFGTGPTPAILAVGASLGLASILGDMTESAFKRIHGLKDMSGLIPGHGGVLDRLDGMIFATTAMTIVLYGNILAATAFRAG